MGCGNSKTKNAASPGVVSPAPPLSEAAAAPVPEAKPALSPAAVATEEKKKPAESGGIFSFLHKDKETKNDAEKELLLEKKQEEGSIGMAVEDVKAISPEGAQTPWKPPTSRTQTDAMRMLEYCQALKDLPDDSPVKQGLRCLCKYWMKPFILIAMFYIWLGKLLYKVYQVLPTNVINALFGAGLCFFGGTYFATFAAVEAAINLGGPDLWRHLTAVWEEANKVAQASVEDDKADADQNGQADVEEMNWNDLISHKAKVAMVAVEDPDRLNLALTALFNLWVAVLATLKFQFAKTIAIALGMANMLLPAATKLVAPLLAGVMGKDLCHWAPTIIDSFVKLLVIVFASFIQETISGYYSALRGGKLFAVAAINIASEKGWMDRLPDSLATKPFDADNSYLDECLAYPLAALGFYYQFSRLFAPPDFPFNLLILPVTIVEWVIRVEIYT